jgi:hypothetical protein
MMENKTQSPQLNIGAVMGSTGSKDWTGNSVSYITTNGFANIRNHNREENDFYATEPKAVKMLMELIDLTNKEVWECACGAGHLSEEMIVNGLDVFSTDLIDRGYGVSDYDFLSEKNKQWKGHIVTNPPYKYAQQFIEKAIDITENGSYIAMFLPIRYTEGKARKKLFLKYPPKHLFISSGRIKCAINGEFNKMKGSAVSYAWFVWQKGFEGDTTVKWFN